jgi:ribose transport system ATP-binding protein
MLRAEGIAKFYGATRALDGVHFEARAGEVHAIVGQNGAGKSTLMGVLAGRIEPDSGQLYLNGDAVKMKSPLHAIELGVAMVYQKRQVVPHLTVAENIFLGRLPRTKLGIVDWRKLLAEARALVDRLGFDLDVSRRVGLLRPAGQQLTEIARALSISAKVLILDEPSAVLCRSELERLFGILRQLRDAGVCILYVTHHLGEEFDIADRVTVLRDGKTEGTYVTGGIDAGLLIAKMVGTEWNEQPRARAQRVGGEALRVERLSVAGAFEDVGFAVREGEVVGLAGLIGSGANELCRSLFGALPYDGGSVFVNGKRVSIRAPHEAREHGFAYLSEDRIGEGIFAELPVSTNITVSALGRFAFAGVLNERAERTWVDRMALRLGVGCAGVRQRAGELSGGNQQKVLLGKWLSAAAKIYILDHPTAGIDVAAKRRIHRLLDELAVEGAAILVLSSDLGELLTLCDRILVMSRGRLVTEMDARKASEGEILRYANAGGGE